MKTKLNLKRMKSNFVATLFLSTTVFSFGYVQEAKALSVGLVPVFALWITTQPEFTQNLVNLGQLGTLGVTASATAVSTTDSWENRNRERLERQLLETVQTDAAEYFATGGQKKTNLLVSAVNIIKGQPTENETITEADVNALLEQVDQEF